MSVLATVAAAAEEGHHEVVNDLIMPAPAFGAVMLVLLSVFVLITWSFRDVAHRHSEKAEQWARENGAENDGHHH